MFPRFLFLFLLFVVFVRRWDATLGLHPRLILVIIGTGWWGRVKDERKAGAKCSGVLLLFVSGGDKCLDARSDRTVWGLAHQMVRQGMGPTTCKVRWVAGLNAAGASMA